MMRKQYEGNAVVKVAIAYLNKKRKEREAERERERTWRLSRIFDEL